MKKIYTSAFFIVLLMFSFVTVSAQSNFFTDIDQSRIAVGNATRVIIPQKFRTVQLNNPAMKSFLWSLPSEKNVLSRLKQTPVIELPMPDGKTARFNVWESSIQEPGLEAKFPDMKTFAGQGIDDPYATLRLDYTPYGFSAQVITVHGSYYIDPYAKGLTSEYISYFRSDYAKSHSFLCEVPDDPDFGRNPIVEAPCRGNEMRVYRLAVACTGEYAQAPGVAAGTSAAVLHAAILKTVNRVVGVYERDITVRLILVANNNIIEYLNAATDPFNGNNNANTLINESQVVIDANIGAANYDIGHTFSTGGGGLAQLNSPCGTSKARGITGSSQPTGDAYDIDYVAHEMGHQLGGNHTMAGCGAAPANTRLEVGGGTSIQAYAGICPGQDIQPNSDPFFHSKSFDEISNFLAGFGATCGVVQPTLNNVPVIDPLPAQVAIPLNTPFTLSGTATDPDGDPLIYSWEQQDFSGASFTAWNAGATAAAGNTVPLFKMRLPKTNGSRTFPDPAVIAAGFPANPPIVMNGLKGETLSPVARPMTFRFIVRDSRAAGGAVASSGTGGCQSSTTFTITVAGTAPFLLTAPNGGETFPGNSAQVVTWDVSGTNAAPFNVGNVRISLSTDGGLTFPTVLAASTPNDGTESVTIPAGATTTARIKVEALGNVFFDISNTNFTITQPLVTFDFTTPTAVNVPCASGTTATSALATTSTGGFTTPIILSATSGVPAGTTVTFSSNPVNPGSSSNVVLNNVNTLAPGTYDVVVTGVAGAVTKTVTVRYVIPLSNPTITTQPADAQACGGTTASFSVAATGGVSYQWQSSPDGTTWTNITGATNASYTTAALLVSQNGNRYRVIVTGACGTTTSAVANLVVNTPVTITNQPVLQRICAGQNASFTVVATGSTITYQWQVSSDGGTNYSNVSNGGVYAGAATATLSLTNPALTYSGNLYRVIVSGVPCGSVNSSAVGLTVNALPGVVLVAAETNNITPYTPTGLYSTVSPPTSTYTYTWFQNGSAVAGQTGASIVPVTVDWFGTYTVRATDANGCSQLSNAVTISDSVDNSLLFVYPNPSVGIFQVRYYSATPTEFSLNVYDSKGARVWTKKYPVNAVYEQMLVDLGRNSNGVYKVDIRDRSGKRLASGSVVIQR